MKQRLLTLLASIMGVLAPMIASAQILSDNATRAISGQTGLGTTGPVATGANITAAVLSLLAVVAVIIIIYAGFMWMTAAGNEERVSSAKKTLVAAVIGLIIILSSLGIAIFVFSAAEQATGFN